MVPTALDIHRERLPHRSGERRMVVAVRPSRLLWIVAELRTLLAAVDRLDGIVDVDDVYILQGASVTSRSCRENLATSLAASHFMSVLWTASSETTFIMTSSSAQAASPQRQSMCSSV